MDFSYCTSQKSPNSRLVAADLARANNPTKNYLAQKNAVFAPPKLQIFIH